MRVYFSFKKFKIEKRKKKTLKKERMFGSKSIDFDPNELNLEYINNIDTVELAEKVLHYLEIDEPYYQHLLDATINKLKKLDPNHSRFKTNIQIKTEKNLVKKELLNWSDTLITDKKTIKSLTNERKALHEKQKGNECYKSKDYQEAIDYYTKSLNYNDKDIYVYTNRSLSYMKLKKYQDAINDCNIAISYDANFYKAYWRRGQSFSKLENNQKAYDDYLYAKKLCDNTHTDYKLIEKSIDKLIAKEQELKKQDQPEILKEQTHRLQIIDVSDSDDSSLSDDDDDQEQQQQQLKMQQILQVINEYKTKAKQLVTNSQYNEAIISYTQAIDKLHELKGIIDKYSFIKFHANYLHDLVYVYHQLTKAKQVVKLCNQIMEYIQQYPQLFTDFFIYQQYSYRLYSHYQLQHFKEYKVDMQLIYKRYQTYELQQDQSLLQQICQQIEDKAIHQYKKVKGTTYMQQQQYQLALEQYQIAIDTLEIYIPSFYQNEIEICKILLNIAFIHLQLKQYQLVKENCTQILSYSSISIAIKDKAYYRRGIALIELKLYKKALHDFNRIKQQSSSTNSLLKQAIEKASDLLKSKKKVISSSSKTLSTTSDVSITKISSNIKIQSYSDFQKYWKKYKSKKFYYIYDQISLKSLP